MGKPYASELAALKATYEQLMTAPIDLLAQALAACASMPLIVVGSGGSLTAAHFTTWLHQRYTGNIAKAVTPLEFVSASLSLSEIGILFVSASGRNPDIIGAFKHAVKHGPKHIIIICSDADSPLAHLAKGYQWINCITFELPVKKDGFLATNSLLATMMYLCRGYVATLITAEELPATYANLISLFNPQGQIDDYLREQCRLLWERDTLIVLYSTTTQMAAFDLESKCTEAALGHVQIADYRNFAHGRHHWLAKRGFSTGVIAFVTDDDRELAQRTLRLLPSDIVVIHVNIQSGGIRASFAALIAALYIVGLAGEACGIDPGRPGVPPFGRKIYHLRALETIPKNDHQVDPPAIRAIERKTHTTLDILHARGELAFWKAAYATFTRSLCQASFRAIVLDYDGTLCDQTKRTAGLQNPVTEHLHRLLQAGIAISIATGRGRSVRQELCKAIPEHWWSRILVGYYNGADIGFLSDENHPNGTDLPCEALRPIAMELQSHTRLQSLATCTCRPMQLTVELTPPASFDIVWGIVQNIVHLTVATGVTMVRSSHSIDVLAPTISKRAVVDRTAAVTGIDPEQILCIGDCGRWPGNDFALLAAPLALSADEVSTDSATGWNLAPVGYRGIQATLAYLQALETQGSFLRWNAQAMEREVTL